MSRVCYPVAFSQAWVGVILTKIKEVITHFLTGFVQGGVLGGV